MFRKSTSSKLSSYRVRTRNGLMTHWWYIAIIVFSNGFVNKLLFVVKSMRRTARLRSRNIEVLFVEADQEPHRTRILKVLKLKLLKTIFSPQIKWPSEWKQELLTEDIYSVAFVICMKRNESARYARNCMTWSETRRGSIGQQKASVEIYTRACPSSYVWVVAILKWEGEQGPGEKSQSLNVKFYGMLLQSLI